MSILSGKKVIIIDDHKLFTSGLFTILESIGLRVMSTFSNGKDALIYLQTNEIDIIFSDINMPKMDGLELCKKLRKNEVSAKIIMLSMYEEPNIIKEAFASGANAYLSKSTEKAEIIKAVKRCLDNKKYINRNLIKKEETKEGEKQKDTFTLKYKLTTRERDVLRLMLKEASNNEIGDSLGISKRTVETHRKNIMLKLGVKNNIGLARIAITYNLFN
jgi:DNA-binding NarL/FixJ family response regulator